MGFLLEISFLSETHWVPKSGTKRSLRSSIEVGCHWRRQLRHSCDPRGARKANHRWVDSCLSWGLGVIFQGGHPAHPPLVSIS